MVENVKQNSRGVGEGVGNWFEGNIRRVVGNGIGTLFWYDLWVGETPLRFKFPRLFDLAVDKVCTVAAMEREGWDVGGGAWVWRRRLFAWEEESVRECSFLLHNCVLQVNAIDKWSWTIDPSHGYSVKEAYRFIASHETDSVTSIVDNVWHRHIPTKVSLFVWRLLRNRLPTRDNLLRRNILQFNNHFCVVGCDSTETAGHLFLSCGKSNILWSLVLAWLGLSLVCHNDLRQHYTQFCFLPGLSRSTHPFFTGIWYACVWVLWKDWNKRIFHNEDTHTTVLLEEIKRTSFFWMKAKNVNFSYCYFDWWLHPLLCMGMYL